MFLYLQQWLLDDMQLGIGRGSVWLPMPPPLQRCRADRAFRQLASCSPSLCSVWTTRTASSF
jgi:hypothetical protein